MLQSQSRFSFLNRLHVCIPLKDSTPLHNRPTQNECTEQTADGDTPLITERLFGLHGKELCCMVRQVLEFEVLYSPAVPFPT